MGGEGGSSEPNMVLSDIVKQRHPQMFANLHSILQNRRAMGTYGRMRILAKLSDSTGMMSKSQVFKYTTCSHQETKQVNQTLPFQTVGHL